MGRGWRLGSVHGRVTRCDRPQVGPRGAIPASDGTHGAAITSFATLSAQGTNPISGIGPYGNGAAAGGVLCRL